MLVVQRPADRRHQFLLTLERALGDAAAIEMPLLSLNGVEHETGEVAVKATGTVELTAQENDTLRRMDVREASATLRSLARSPHAGGTPLSPPGHGSRGAVVERDALP